MLLWFFFRTPNSDLHDTSSILRLQAYLISTWTCFQWQIGVENGSENLPRRQHIERLAKGSDDMTTWSIFLCQQKTPQKRGLPTKHQERKVDRTIYHGFHPIKLDTVGDVMFIKKASRIWGNTYISPLQTPQFTDDMDGSNLAIFRKKLIKTVCRLTYRYTTYIMYIYI